MTEQEFYQFLGEKVREFRKAAKMTQDDVCSKAGIYQQDLSAFENRGDKIRGAFTINEIILATGRTWVDLFRSSPEKKTPLKLTFTVPRTS